MSSVSFNTDVDQKSWPYPSQGELELLIIPVFLQLMKWAGVIREAGVISEACQLHFCAKPWFDTAFVI